ncbi:MAG: AAA family ATPase [Dysgonamonadaceae bacterium]|jgi:predicted AAA+ superfamily ATPase|nr:AAA family ATPase [Dysgonamonadaceae bacterium]
MESLYKTHRYLLENNHTLVRRQLMDEINWNDRLIGIKGSRGVGKTSFLIDYAKENFQPADRQCLYVNLNNFYFTVKTIRDFANEFQMKGGKVLLIDQIFKYPDWWTELAYCHENFPDLKIVFTASSVIDLGSDHYYLADKVAVYNLRGFSFREYLELETKFRFQSYKLEDILEKHVEIATDICSKIKPLAYLDSYLQYGFYPFFLEKRNFSENLLKTMNMMMEVDILSVNQIEQSYLPKIRKLFYLLSLLAPGSVNISRLSHEVEISRATVMNYIKYLKDARLINLLYPAEEVFPKKPAQVYVHNPNLAHISRQINGPDQTLRETFFYNQIHKAYKVNLGIKNSRFLVDSKYHFNVGDKIKGKFNPDVYYAIDGIERGERKVIPLWLFGFLY